MARSPIITTTKVTGLKELDNMLNQLTHKNFRKQALMNSGRTAMAQMLADAITGAPMLSGENLDKNPNVKAGTLKNDIKYVGKYNLSPKIKASGRGKGRAQPLKAYEYIGRIMTGKASEGYSIPVEYGRDEFIAVRTVVFGRDVAPYEVKIAKIKPQPFMRQALDNNSKSSIQIFQNEMTKNIFDRVKRQRKIRRKK